jgi:hypothetical protein
VAGESESYALALAEVAPLRSGLPRLATAASGGDSRTFPVAGIIAIALAISAAAYGLAQSPSEPDWQKPAGGKMSFDVASVKLDTSAIFKPPSFGLNADDSYMHTGGRFTADFELPVYIQFAYKLWLTRQQEDAMLSHLPGWVSSDRYEIEAEAPGNPTKDQMRLMMQSLLADRFKLAVHFETRQGKIMALTLAKPGKTGPNLRAHEEGPPCDTPIPLPMSGPNPGHPAVFPPM